VRARYVTPGTDKPLMHDTCDMRHPHGESRRTERSLIWSGVARAWRGVRVLSARVERELHAAL